MVVIRLKRMGRTHRPFYRLCVMDQRSPVDGRAIEQVGWYNPIGPADQQVNLKIDRIDYWLGVGAQPSRTVASLLRKAGCDPKPGKRTPTAPATAPAPAPATA